MSLPTNSSKANNRGCVATSSNCVVWEGPDLDCISLCRGDTISEVVAKMAEELCILIDLFEITDFDFSCLQIQPSDQPANAQELIQVLIDRICALEGINPSSGSSTDSCPDCIVSIATCFQYINETGDTVTTMDLLDYVTAIGNRICIILTDITTLQGEVDTLQTQIGDAQSDISALQTDKVDEDTLQYEVSTTTDPSAGVQFITDALRSIENSLIRTQDATGTPTELYQNMLKAGNIASEDRLDGGGVMSSISGWNNTVEDLADSVGNIWLTLRDIREAVDYMLENCCSTGCGSLFLNFRATIEVLPSVTYLYVFTDGSTGFTSDWKECTGDTRVRVEDALGNTTTFRTSLLDLIDTPSGFQIDITGTAIDPTTDIEVIAETCFLNTSTETTCEKEYDYSIQVSPDCPSVVLTVFATSVSYQFTPAAGYSYIINIYYDGSSSPVATQIIATPGVIVANTISTLLSETDYDFEVTIVDTSGNETVCARQDFTTLPDNCVPPTGVTTGIATP